MVGETGKCIMADERTSSDAVFFALVFFFFAGGGYLAK